MNRTLVLRHLNCGPAVISSIFTNNQLGNFLRNFPTSGKGGFFFLIIACSFVCKCNEYPQHFVVWRSWYPPDKAFSHETSENWQSHRQVGTLWCETKRFDWCKSHPMPCKVLWLDRWRISLVRKLHTCPWWNHEGRVGFVYNLHILGPRGASCCVQIQARQRCLEEMLMWYRSKWICSSGQRKVPMAKVRCCVSFTDEKVLRRRRGTKSSKPVFRGQSINNNLTDGDVSQFRFFTKKNPHQRLRSISDPTVSGRQFPGGRHFVFLLAVSCR